MNLEIHGFKTTTLIKTTHLQARRILNTGRTKLFLKVSLPSKIEIEQTIKSPTNFINSCCFSLLHVKHPNTAKSTLNANA